MGAMSRIILHADMDAFYASIEQRDRPELRGRPVVIGGLGPRGVVSTASYEARPFGVHSAQPTAQARRLCPDAVYLTPRMEHYVSVSRQVREVFDGFTDLVEPLSLDEAFLDVSGSTRLFGDGVAIAERLRAQVLERTGLTVSVGVAANKYVAKVASDLDKPDGLTHVPAGQEAAFLAPLPVGRLWGAGKATQARLGALGLRTLGDVQRRSEAELVAALGDASGRHFFRLCRGQDERPVVPDRDPKSVSRETTFGQDVADDARLRDVLLELAEDVGRRLRKQGLAGRTVRLKLRYPPFETHSRQVRLPAPTDEDLVLFRAARGLLEALRPPGKPVRLIGVGAADLGPAGEKQVQGDLFAAAEGPEPGGEVVDRTLDAIRDRFGSGAAGRAGPSDAGGADGPGAP